MSLKASASSSQTEGCSLKQPTTTIDEDEIILTAACRKKESRVYGLRSYFSTYYFEPSINISLSAVEPVVSSTQVEFEAMMEARLSQESEQHCKDQEERKERYCLE